MRTLRRLLNLCMAVNSALLAAFSVLRAMGDPVPVPLLLTVVTAALLCVVTSWSLRGAR